MLKIIYISVFLSRNTISTCNMHVHFYLSQLCDFGFARAMSTNTVVLRSIKGLAHLNAISIVCLFSLKPLSLSHRKLVRNFWLCLSLNHALINIFRYSFVYGPRAGTGATLQPHCWFVVSWSYLVCKCPRFEFGLIYFLKNRFSSHVVFAFESFSVELLKSKKFLNQSIISKFWVSGLVLSVWCFWG